MAALTPKQADALIGRILERWKRREAELRGRRVLLDLNSAKADGIADCLSELTIHRPSLFPKLKKYRPLG